MSLPLYLSIAISISRFSLCCCARADLFCLFGVRLHLCENYPQVVADEAMTPLILPSIALGMRIRPGSGPVRFVLTGLPLRGTIMQYNDTTGGQGDAVGSVPAAVTDPYGRVFYAHTLTQPAADSSRPDALLEPDAVQFATVDAFGDRCSNTVSLEFYRVHHPPVTSDQTLGAYRAPS
jgi:hypothetical protein